MKKASFIQSLATACGLIVLLCTCNASATDRSGSRELFNTDWLFARFGSMPKGSTLPEPKDLQGMQVDDASWRKLDLPHDWGIEGPFRDDLPSNTGKLPWVGIGWYRKHFKVSPADKGLRCFIDFDGAMSHAKVWLNGHYLGEWPYGYASFRLEMTPYVRFDGENVLAVRLDNPENSSRWYPGGGIYRNVWLVKTSPVHFAHWGTFVTTPSITKDRAIVHIRTEIENQSTKSVKTQARVRFMEEGQTDVITSASTKSLTISAGVTRSVDLEMKIQSPKLWSLNSRNLYRVETSIFENGKRVDVGTTLLGIRTARFSVDSGFVLNGERARLNGVCNHHDLGLLGTAVNERALERQISLLQEMGCNAIRTSHNPPSPELLDLCDRMGVLVLDEAFDCWEHGKTPNDYNTLFKDWHERDIRALVRRDRNHPCVIAWSAGNEVREQSDGILVGKLRDIFRSEDSTRPVTAACDNPQAGFDGFQNAVDVFGYNYKPHLYTKFRDANPTKPLYGSETASCVSTNGEYFYPVSDDKSKGAMNSQVSSYDLSAPPWATIPDVEFAGEDKNPSVAGEFVWTGFDYLGEPTPYGEDTSQSRSSYFGILDLCGFKKDRFYLYQARWRPDFPMAHILPHWNWPDRIGKVTPVHVYTSGDEAELFLNGESLGRQKKGPFQYRLRWDSVKYMPGELKVIAYKDGKKWAEDVKKTTGQAAKVGLTLDQTSIRSDGKDLVFVTVETLDKDGLRNPLSRNVVRFRVSGPGLIVAVGNSDPTDHDSFQSDRCKAFGGRCLLIIRSVEGKTGEIRLEAESDGLIAGNVVFSSK
jgi:beta-galactosidase